MRAWPLLALAALLSACAGGPPGPSADQPTTVLTASDQTDLERRARVRLELATAYFSRGQLETALDETKLAMQVKPDMAEAFNLRALIYAAMGEDRLAEDSFNRALQLNPRDGATLHNQAWFLCQRGQYGTAQARFDTLLALPNYRDQARSLLARGVCYGRDGKFAEAEAALMRAYELDPANPSTGLNLAEVLYRRQAWERASFYIGRINDAPDAANAQTLWLAARIERKLGRDAAVRVLGDRLRQRFAQSPEAALFERGRFDD
ncbi:MAG: type IV pilus biogenesis/stability protein PilW [Pseudomonadota bacterium]